MKSVKMISKNGIPSLLFRFWNVFETIFISFQHTIHKSCLMTQGGDCPLSCMGPAGPAGPVLSQTHPEGNVFRKWNGMFNSAGTDYHTLANQANTMVHVYMPHKYTMGGCQTSAETRKKKVEIIKPCTDAPCVPHATTQKRQEFSAFFSGIPLC